MLMKQDLRNQYYKTTDLLIEEIVRID